MRIDKSEYSGEFIGSNEEAELFVESNIILPDDDNYYRIVIFDITTDKFLEHCGYDSPSDSCSVDLNWEFTLEDTMPGIHEYQAFIEEIPDNDGDPASVNDLGNVIAESNVFEWERQPISAPLVSNSPYVSQNFNDPVEETYPKISLESNQYFPGSGHYVYFIDLTENRIIESEQLRFSKDIGANADIEQFLDDRHYYQAIIAKSSPDTPYNDPVEQVEDLDGIIYTSNIVSKTRKPWSLNHVISFGTSTFTVNIDPGGGEYSGYLADRETGNLLKSGMYTGGIWTVEDPENPYSDPHSTTNAIAFIAENHPSEQPNPTNISDFDHIIATSDGLVDDIGNPGVTDPKQIAGGSNPSEICNTKCSGDPINNFTGEFFDSETDLAVAGSGLSPDSTRHFSTQLKDELNAMGYGWRNSYEMNLKVTEKRDEDGEIIEQDIPLVDAYSVDFVQENGAISSFTKKSNGDYSGKAKTKATLKWDSAASEFKVTRDKRVSFFFDATGKLKRVVDIHGNTLTMSYATNGRLATVVDNHSNALTFTYNSAGLIDKVQDQTGRFAAYTYNAQRLVSVTNEHGVSTSYTYDSQRRVKKMTDGNGGITENFYDSENRVILQHDPLLKKLRFTYNHDVEANTMVTTITYPNARIVEEHYSAGLLHKMVENPGTNLEKTWHYSYDEFGNKISVVNPDGSTTSSFYDGEGNLVKHINALGGVSEFTHDSFGNILTAKDFNGKTTTNTYDAVGNLLSTTTPLGYTTTFQWNTDGTIASVIDARGNKSGANPNDYKTVSSYTGKGLISTVTNPAAGVTSFEYDSVGRAIGQVSPRGNETGSNPAMFGVETDYNGLDLPAVVRDQKDNETAISYDNKGNVTVTEDALGIITEYEYDLMDRNTSITDSEGTQTFSYNGVGQVTSATDKLGNTTTFVYNKSGDLISTKDPLLNTTKFSYDKMGRIILSTDAAGNKTQYRYDALGNLVWSKDALGGITRNYYNAGGQLTSSQDTEGRITSYEYADDGRLITVTNPNNTTVSYAYDEVGNIISHTNAGGKTETWTYDSLNRKTSYTNADNQTETYSYDADSNQIQTVRKDDSIVSVEYDATGSPAMLDYPGTDSDVTYGYDALGRTISESMGGKTTSTVYDDFGRILSRGTTGNTVTYEYDAEGRNTLMSYPSGRTVSYAYDAASNLTSTNASGIGEVTYRYDQRNIATAVTLPNSVIETRAIDTLGRKTGITVKNSISDLELYKNSKTYSATGNLTSTSVSSGSVAPVVENYTHDVMDRTTGNDSGFIGASGQYSYNDAGVLTSLANETVVSDDIGKPLSVGTKNLGYDNIGQRISETVAGSTTRELEWNVDGTLDSVSAGLAGLVGASYSYTADGLVNERVSGTETDSFVWDSTSENALLLSDGEYEYVYGLDRVPVAQVDLDTDEVTYLHTDQNGSVTAVTDESGVLAGQANYGAYGKRLGSGVSRFGFAGEWVDEATGYVFLRARWYDPLTASFLSEDPIVQITNEAYGYAGGNPLVRIDPSGLAFVGKDHQMSAWDKFWYSPFFSVLDTQAAQNVSDASAGFGDAASFGLTQMARESMEYDDVVDKCSGFYIGGGATASAATIFVPGSQIKTGLQVGKVITGAKGASHTIGKSGGRYGDIYDDLQKNLRKNDADIHHMPSNKWNNATGTFNRNDGGAILIDKFDHRLTRTYGGRNAKVFAEEKNLAFKTVLDRDILDIRTNFGNKYDSAILDMLRYYKKVGAF